MATQKILVVDDEVFVRDLLNEFLGKQGYDVALAESGEAAVGYTKSNQIDVALVDLKMPGIDGLETLNQIINIDPNIPVIIMTGYPTIETSIKALRLGAYDYVIKPFKLNELKGAVEKAIKERKLKVEIDYLRKKIRSIEGELEQFDIDESGSEKTEVETAVGIEETSTAGKDAFSNEILDQIRQLGALKETGILTEKEFEEKKAELLSRL